MSTVTSITFSKARLFDGLPWCHVNGQWWDGFTSYRGVVFVKVDGLKSWLEHHGDLHDLEPGGMVITHEGNNKLHGWNLWPGNSFERAASIPKLWLGSVNKSRIRMGRPAVTVYGDGKQILTDQLRFEGEVWSTRLERPVITSPEPLNWWIETTGRVEY